MLRKSTLILLLALLWASTIKLNNQLESTKATQLWQRERVSAVISSPKVIPYLLGYETILADYIWIKTMLYFGGQYNNNRDFKWLTSMLDGVTLLNPSFYPAYEFGGLMVAQVSDDYNYSRALLDRGISRVGERREFLMFLNAWLNYSELKDYNRAADLMELAAHWKKAPPFWGTFAATIRSESGDTESSIQFLQELFLSAANPTVRGNLLDKIIDLEEKEQSKIILKSLYERSKDKESQDLVIEKLEKLIADTTNFVE